VADNATVRLDWDNEPQPDAFLRILPVCGGQTRDESGYVAQGPEWAGEITATSASYDLHDKKEAYRRNGVREYLVWRVQENAIDWFVLRGGRYDPLVPGEDGICRSEVFPGLWLDSAALIRGEMRPVLQVLEQGLATPEHAEFVKQLRNATSK
jgi:Uma2 family endonuclease